MIKIVMLLILYLNPQIIFAGHDQDVMNAKLKVAEMVKQDQAVRMEIMAQIKQKTLRELTDLGCLDKLNKIDVENSREVKKILAKLGWPTKAVFGKKYCEDIWLLVQHADRDIALQKLALTNLGKVVRTDKSEAKHYAYLWDRVKMNQQLPQRYGTQGKCLKKHYWEPIKIEDEKNLNKRRYSIGLDSMEHYRKLMNEFCL